MTRAHLRYLATEAAIAIVVNALLSLVFVLLVFGGRAQIPVSGHGGIIQDALPQSFMVALMSCLVPTLLTRRRAAAGTIATLPARWPRPRSALLRALMIASMAAASAWCVQALLLPQTGPAWRFTTLLAFKCSFGAALGAMVAALSVRLALADSLLPTGSQGKSAKSSHLATTRAASPSPDAPAYPPDRRGLKEPTHPTASMTKRRNR